jgi:hypothetical protein
MATSSTLDTRRIHPYVVEEIRRERALGIKSKWTTSKIKRKSFPDRPDEIISIKIYKK